jgi:hypothetical protein
MLAVNATAEGLKSLGRFDLFQEQIQPFVCGRKVADGRGDNYRGKALELLARAEIETDLGRADRAKKLGGCLFAAR